MRGIGGVWRAAALGAACMLSFPTIASAQAAKAGVVTTLQGTATVARATAVEPAPLRFRDDVFIQDHIVTGESSIVRILLGGKAVVTVRERSALTIHETPTTSTIELGSGKIALAVAKNRMKPGESVQIKTPNAMAGVRGTVVIAEVAPAAQPGGTITTRFTLLTGIVDVARVDGSTGRPTGQAVMLQPLQTIAVTGSLPPGAVRAISRAEAQAIAKDYKVSLPAPPPPVNTQVTEQQIEIAVRHSAALTGGQPGTGDGTVAAAPRSSNGDENASGGDASNPTRVTVGTRGTGGTSATGGGTSVGGGGIGVTASVGGGGGVNATGGISTGGGGVSAGVGVGVGSGIGAGGGVTVGGGGIGAGGGVTVGGGGGIGAGVGVTVGGGGIGVGGGITVGGGGTGGGITVGGGGGGTGTGGGGGGLIGGIVPKLPKLLP